MTTPAITVTGTLQDIFGGAENGCSLLVTLCNYGPNLPRISGTSLLAKIAPLAVACPSGSFSFTLWGNDVISPLGTYYTFQVLDDQGNVVQTAAYQFTGSGTVDLSQATPYIIPIASLPVSVGRLILPPVMVAFSATPTFNANAGSYFRMTLTGNVTGSTLSNPVDGQVYIFELIEDGTGGRSFTWPANFLGAMSITGGAPAGGRYTQAFVYDGGGGKFVPLSAGTLT